MAGIEPGGAFEISLYNQDFFTNAANDDLNVRTMLPRQRILMGTTSNAPAAVMITSNNIVLNDNVYVKSKLGVGRSNFDLYPVDIIGNTAIDGNVNMTKYMLCRGVQLRKKSGSYYAPTDLPIGSMQGISNDTLGMNFFMGGGSASNYYLFKAAGNDVLRIAGDGTLRVPQKMYIGSNILWSVQNTLSLNDTLYATQMTGRVGIGTTTPATTLDVTGTDAIYLPRGTTMQRPSTALQGFIRYNTTVGSFEGYGSGNTWGSLGGVKDTNQDTYISAESFPTSNDDTIRFINSNVETVRVMPNGFVGLSNAAPSERLEVSGGNAKISNNLYVMSQLAIGQSNPSAALDVTGSAKISSNLAVISRTTIGINNVNYAATESLDMLGNAKISSNVYVLSRLGVATSNPTESLDLLGNLKASSNIYAATRLAIGSSNPTESLDLLGNLKTSSNAYVMSRIGVSTSNPTESLDLLGNLKASSNIYAATRLAIGSSNPTESLDLLGNLKTSSNAYVMSRIGVSTSNPTESLDLLGNLKASSNIYASSRLAIGSSNPTESLDLLGNLKASSNAYVMSRIGVSTSNPTESLDLLGNIKASSNIYAATRLAIGSSNPTESLDLLGNLKASSNAYVMSRIGVSTSNPTESLDLQGNLKASSNVYAMSRLGISTSNPMEALDMQGNLKASSNVYAMSRLGISTSNPMEALDMQGNLKASSNVYAMTSIGVGTSNPMEALDVKGNMKASGNVCAMSNVGIGLSNPSVALEVQGSVIMRSNLEVRGDLSIMGTTTTVNATTVTIADNIIRLNNGAAYTTNLQAGLEVNRGIGCNNYYFIFDEATQYFKTGLQGSLQTVCTRDDTIVDSSIAFYNAVNNRITGCNGLTYSNGSFVMGAVPNTNAIQALAPSLTSTQQVNLVLGKSNTPSNAALIRYTQGVNNPSCASQFGLLGMNHITCQGNGMVGINNATPSNRLDVVGNVRINHSQSLQLTVQDGSGTSTNAVFMDFNNANSTARGIIGLDGSGFKNASAGALTMATWTNHDMLFLTNQTERMRITGTGNVGIGTTPSYPLDVRVGTVNAIAGRFSDPTTDLLINPGKRFGTNTAGWTSLDPGGGSTTNGVAFWDNVAVSGGMAIGTDGTYGQATVPSGNLVTSGNIGVGTMTPASRLDVAGNVRVSHNQSLQMTITDTSGTSTNALFMDFNNANTTARGIIGLDGTGFVNSSAGALTMATWTNHNIVFATNQVEVMRMTSNGNLGIGTTNPQYRLHVGGGATTLDGSTTGDHRVIICKQNAGNVGSILFTQGGNTGSQGFGEIGLAGDNSMSFKVNASAGSYTTRMYMTASNIGINNTAPLELLHVTGKIYSDTQYVSSAANDSVTTPSYAFREDSNTGIFHPATSTLGFTTNGVERARIGTSGMGINTILTPTCTLDINGNLCVKSTTVPELRFINSNNNQQCVIAMATFNGQHSTSATTNDLIVRTDNATSRLHLQVTNQSAAITVNSNNFVGINTTNPTYRLHVNGNIFASDDITAFSDGRYKSNVVPIPDALDKVSQMNGYYYTLGGKKSVGVIAQEMIEILPEVVNYDEPHDKYGVCYGNITAILIEAIKELKTDVRQLQDALRKAGNI